jgi:hypothetical protein
LLRRCGLCVFAAKQFFARFFDETEKTHVDSPVVAKY